MVRWYVLQVSTGQETAVHGAGGPGRPGGGAPRGTGDPAAAGAGQRRSPSLLPAMCSWRWSTAPRTTRVKAIPMWHRASSAPTGFPPLPRPGGGVAAAAGQRRRELHRSPQVEELPGGGVRIVEGVLRNFPISSIDYDIKAHPPRQRWRSACAGEPKSLHSPWRDRSRRLGVLKRRLQEAGQNESGWSVPPGRLRWKYG